MRFPTYGAIGVPCSASRLLRAAPRGRCSRSVGQRTESLQLGSAPRAQIRPRLLTLKEELLRRWSHLPPFSSAWQTAGSGARGGGCGWAAA